MTEVNPKKHVGSFDGSPVDVLTHEEKERIRVLLAAGKSQKDIAEETGRSPGAIRKVMKLTAAMARTDVKVYGPAERIRLVNLTFEKFEELLVTCNDRFQFRAMISGLKELCDIRRIEEGLAPSETLMQFQMSVVVQGQQPVVEDDLPDIVDGTFTREVEQQKELEEQEPEEEEYDPLKDV